MGRIINGTRVITGEVRFSYLHVFEKYAANPGQEEKYSVCLLIPKTDNKTVSMIQEACANAIDIGQKAKWGGKVPKNLKMPLRDGDEEKDTDENPEYKGMYFLNATAKRQPGIVDKYKQDILDREELKSGDFGKAAITFFAFAASGNNGIGVGIDNIMKTRDGESFGGGRASAESDFAEEFEDEDDLF